MSLDTIISGKAANIAEAQRIATAEKLKAAENYLTEIDNRITGGDTVNYYNLGLDIAQDVLTVEVKFNDSEDIKFSYSPIGDIIGQCVQNDVSIMQTDITTQGNIL